MRILSPFLINIPYRKNSYFNGYHREISESFILPLEFLFFTCYTRGVIGKSTEIPDFLREIPKTEKEKPSARTIYPRFRI